MKEKILFIINPVSGIGKQKTVEDALEKHLDKEKFDYSIAYTEYPHHAGIIAHEASEQGYDTVVAVGGDGSINDCVQGLVHTNVRLGIIPAGSGNGLARCLHIPLSVDKAIEVINNNSSLNMDAVYLNDRPYASIAGIGFDALIAKEFSASTIRGFQTYLRLVLQHYFNYAPHHYRLLIDGELVETDAMFISFANSDQFGFNAVIAPKASVNDGELDVTIVKKVPMILAPIAVQQLFFHMFDKSPYVKSYKARNVKVLDFEDGLINLDGEGIETESKELDFRVEHDSLNVIIPNEKHMQIFPSESKIMEYIKSFYYNEQK